MDKKKRFIVTIVSSSLFFWLAQMVLGGFIQALVGFFTRKKLEKMKEERKKDDVKHNQGSE